MALLGYAYREQLLPRQAFRDMFAFLLERAGERAACHTMVDLLPLAHDRRCEARLARELDDALRLRQLPDLDALRSLFSPQDSPLPGVDVQFDSLSSYNGLLDRSRAANGGPA